MSGRCSVYEKLESRDLSLETALASVSVSVELETRRSDDLYTGASPDGDGVEAERWPLLGGDGGRKE